LKPGIYDLDAGAAEVGHVASCQRGAVGPADGRDQRVEARDWFPGPFAAASNDYVMFRGCGIDRQDLVGKGRKISSAAARRICFLRPSGSRAMPYRTSASVTAVVRSSRLSRSRTQLATLGAGSERISSETT